MVSADRMWLLLCDDLAYEFYCIPKLANSDPLTSQLLKPDLSDSDRHDSFQHGIPMDSNRFHLWNHSDPGISNHTLLFGLKTSGGCR